MKRSRLAAVLWDMDGTLVDTEPFWHDAEQELVSDFDGTWDESDQASLTGFDLRDAAVELQTRGGVQLEVDEIVERLLGRVVARVAEEIPWRPGARELLGELHEAGIPCALVSMSWRVLVDAIISELPEGAFKITVSGDEVVRGKPHPEPYLTAAAGLSVDPRDCVAIEDSPTGLRSAVDAGCAVVAVANLVPLASSDEYVSIDTLANVHVDDLAKLVPTPRDRRRTVALLVAAAVIVAGAVIAVIRPGHRNTPAPPPVPPATIAFDAWVPSFLLPDSTASLAANGTLFREIMPFWYTLDNPGSITLTTDTTPDVIAQVTEVAKQDRLKMLPSILDKTSSGVLASLLADPAQRRQHVEAIVKLVADGRFDGIDLDYEQFGYNDPHSSWEVTAVDFVSFVRELSVALHSAGKLLSVTLPPVYDAGRTDASGYWVYDYRALAPLVDRIRVLAYDYSTSDPGPIAPLDFVRRAIAGARATVKETAKVDLAVPLYGYNWVLSTEGTCSADAQIGRTNVSQRGIDDLLAKRSATPIHDTTTGEASFTYQVQYTDGTNTCTQTRQVNYVDTEGTRERIDLARTSFLGGVSIWALGFDGPATWTTVSSLAGVQG